MYIRVSDQRYPVTERQIRKFFPSTCFPSPFVPPEGIEKVWPSVKPSHEVLQMVVQGAPEYRDERWYVTWEVVDKFEEPDKEAKEQDYLDRLLEASVEKARVEAYEAAQSTSGMQKVTVAQANAFIDANVSDPGTALVLKKMALFILK